MLDAFQRLTNGTRQNGNVDDKKIFSHGTACEMECERSVYHRFLSFSLHGIISLALSLSLPTSTMLLHLLAFSTALNFTNPQQTNSQRMSLSHYQNHFSLCFHAEHLCGWITKNDGFEIPFLLSPFSSLTKAHDMNQREMEVLHLNWQMIRKLFSFVAP